MVLARRDPASLARARPAAQNPTGHRGDSEVPDLTVVLIALIALFAAATRESVAQQPRSVAVTFDDLPMTRVRSLADMQAMTARLLDGLERYGIVTVGFVNEIKLDQVPGEAAARRALLASWLDHGHELGNHTYSHRRLYDTRVAAWGDDVLRGERVTRALMAERGRALRYFRHPTLNTGRDLAAKAEADRFLADHGYLVAPVTVDNDEYLYALAYDRARARGDSLGVRRLGADYVRYMEEMFAYCERLSVAVVGREIPQVLLVHANWLNADYLPGLAEMLRRRGYRFTTVEEALEDPAYALPDRYVGRRGPSWLERWAVTQGRTVEPQPAIPTWVREAAR
jgi:peptidoglycan/xylan/chitin deacetylase (PgdA/CDA1 family)